MPMTNLSRHENGEKCTHFCEIVLANYNVANLRTNVNSFVTKGGGRLLTNIMNLCKERGISMAELERQCGLAQRTIYKWDKNIPSVDKVKRVADYLGVCVDDLIAGIEKEGEKDDSDED